MGTIAVPGDASCHEVGSCGNAPWGDIPVESDTQYVDGSYSGADSDGTSTRPWTTIQDGVTAAASGAIVAITDGSYSGPVFIEGKPVRLRGRCARRVEVVGQAGDYAAVEIDPGGDATEVDDLAVRGPTVGVDVLGAAGVALSRLWIHDTDDDGLVVEDALVPAEATVRDTLIERASNLGIQVLGSMATIERSDVRETRPTIGATFGGEGVRIGIHTSANRGSTGTIRASLIEANHGVGVLVASSDATVEGSVVRDMLPQGDGTGGIGVLAQSNDAGAPRSKLTVSSSLVSNSHDFGIEVLDSDASVEATVVRGTQPGEGDANGPGIGVATIDSAMPATADIRSCLVEENAAAGVYADGANLGVTASIVRNGQPDGVQTGYGQGIDLVGASTAAIKTTVIEHNIDSGLYATGSDVTLSGSLIHDTLPNAIDMQHGRGIDAEDDPTSGVRSHIEIDTSVIADNRQGGVLIDGSDLKMESTLVRDTKSQVSNHENGVGMMIQLALDTHQRSTASVRSSSLDLSIEVGLACLDSDVTIDTTLVRNTKVQESDASYGDGVAVINYGNGASIALSGSRIESSARAGLTVFSATASLKGVTLECNVIQLDGEDIGPATPGFHDLGGNVCGCAGTLTSCQVQSNMLTPPVPL